MKIGIPGEIDKNECRVACTPTETARLIELGFSVLIEDKAGLAAGFSNRSYTENGAEIAASARQLWGRADIICKVQSPRHHAVEKSDEVDWLTGDKTLICFIWPGQNPGLVERLRATGATVLAMDAIPRISRAQKMDALSSMSNIAGYRAVIEAAQHFGRFFTGQITAAGKVDPATVLVIGAGVAGLAAIGTATSLGAIVRAFDTRPEVKEQIESLNATFLELDFAEDGSGAGGYAKVMSDEFIQAEMALLKEQAKQVDIIITTALIPGKPAPKLITREMVDSMKPGSVIVDLAAEQGGNCEYTEPGNVARVNDVSIVGYTDLPSRMAAQSSQLYATNIRHLITDLAPNRDGVIHIDMEDQVIRGTTVTHQGEITWPPPVVAPVDKPQQKSEPEQARPAPPETVQTAAVKNRAAVTLAGMAVGMLAILGLGSVAPAEFMSHFTVFVLACFVGWQVIWNVTPALHTPLMSVTNAISGIIVIGAILQIDSSSLVGVALAITAVTIASVNIAGGFLVTQRMLNMFRK